MKATLFPHTYRRYGWFLLIPGIALGLAYVFYDIQWDFLRVRIPAFMNDSALDEILIRREEEGSPFWRWENLTDELAGLMILIGALMVAFSKEKVEDEYLVHLRLSALLWAVYVNAGLVVLAMIFLYSFHFLYFMMGNLFSVLLLFIVRYHWLLARAKREAHDE